MVRPIIDQEIATEDEVDANFNLRSIQKQFKNMQTDLLIRISNNLFKLNLDPIYKGLMFLNLDMEAILNKSFICFLDQSETMTVKVQR